MTTAASGYLLDLGRAILMEYAKLPGVACAAITGSAAEGLSDNRSDLDMTMYYDAFPAEAEIRAVRERVGGGALTWSLGNYGEGEFIESFHVKGVDCQIGHTTVAVWERDMGRVLVGDEPGSPLHKAMSGTLVSIAVSGEDRLRAWQRKIADYPRALRVAMVRHHLKFFAIWGVWDRLKVRDSNLWFRQAMVDASFNLLGVSAGLSGKYFTPFQFKRGGAFVRSLGVAPVRLWERLEELWHVPTEEAVEALRELVAETVVLVEHELPEVETAAVQKSLGRNDQPWAVR